MAKSRLPRSSFSTWICLFCDHSRMSLCRGRVLPVHRITEDFGIVCRLGIGRLALAMLVLVGELFATLRSEVASASPVGTP
jgi:hypothetical protein